MIIGYARVSTINQDLELQTAELKKAGCEKIYSESISGKDNNRPELTRMLEILRAGDTVMVYKIDRVARSLKGLIDIVELFDKKGVEFRSLDSSDKVDTTSPMGKAFYQISGVYAELERGMIRARTQAGIKRALEKGIKFGRAHGSFNKNSANKIERIGIFLKAGRSSRWIAKELSVSFSTISNIRKILKDKQSLST